MSSTARPRYTEYITELFYFRYVALSAKRPVRESSCPRIGLSVKRLVREWACPRIVLSANWLSANWFVREKSSYLPHNSLRLHVGCYSYSISVLFGNYWCSLLIRKWRIWRKDRAGSVKVCNTMKTLQLSMVVFQCAQCLYIPRFMVTRHRVQ